jgi:hypothetical protein
MSFSEEEFKVLIKQESPDQSGLSCFINGFTISIINSAAIAPTIATR